MSAPVVEVPDAPSCSRCDADMIRRMDMETARWFWDCPNECDRAKPKWKKKPDKDAEKSAEEMPSFAGRPDAISDRGVIDYKTGPGIAIGMSADSAPLASYAIGAQHQIADGDRVLTNDETTRRLAELDAKQADLERRLAERRSGAGQPVVHGGGSHGMGGAITIQGGTGGTGGATPPRPQEVSSIPPVAGAGVGSIYYDTTTGTFRVLDGNGKHVAVHPTMTCPVLRTNTDGSTALCGRPTELLGGEPNKDRLCWLHAAPVDSPVQHDNERRSRVAVAVCSFGCAALAGAAALYEAGSARWPVVAIAAVAGGLLLPFLLWLDAARKRNATDKKAGTGVASAGAFFILLILWLLTRARR